jgi:hypothetical protein
LFFRHETFALFASTYPLPWLRYNPLIKINPVSLESFSSLVQSNHHLFKLSEVNYWTTSIQIVFANGPEIIAVLITSCNVIVLHAPTYTDPTKKKPEGNLRCSRRVSKVYATYCVVFLFCLSSSCVSYVTSFSGLSIFAIYVLKTLFGENI